MKRTVALVSLLFVAVANVWLAATPAGAAGACKKAKPGTPQSLSSNAADAPKERVVKVTAKATADDPIVIEYAHGPGVADQSVGQVAEDPEATMLVEDAKFFNFQLVTNDRISSVNARIDWGAPSPSDIDLRWFDEWGTEIDYSASFNPALNAATLAVLGGDDDNGFEQVIGLPLARCSTFTIESRPAWSPGEDAVTLKVWVD